MTVQILLNPVMQEPGDGLAHSVWIEGKTVSEISNGLEEIIKLGGVVTAGTNEEQTILPAEVLRQCIIRVSYVKED